MIRVVLLVLAGPIAGTRWQIDEGEVCRFGRMPDSGVALGDEFTSRVHFAVGCRGSKCVLKDFSRNGTQVNGKPVREIELDDGDVITAGKSVLEVRIEQTVIDPVPGLIALVRRQTRGVFGVFDGARDKAIVPLLQQSPQRVQSLYEGSQGEALAQVAPHLVAIDPALPYFEALLRQAWGNAWGVLITSPVPFDAVRNRLRRFLLVSTDDGQRVVFRYYDPRVLRVFLPTCDVAQLTEMFGEISSYLAESETAAEAIEFTVSGQGLQQCVVPLGQGAAEAARA